LGYQLSISGEFQAVEPGITCKCGNQTFVDLGKEVRLMGSRGQYSCTSCGNFYGKSAFDEEWMLQTHGGTEGPVEEDKVFVKGFHPQYEKMVAQLER
jgi:hypothetical protein